MSRREAATLTRAFAVIAQRWRLATPCHELFMRLPIPYNTPFLPCRTARWFCQHYAPRAIIYATPRCAAGAPRERALLPGAPRCCCRYYGERRGKSVYATVMPAAALLLLPAVFLRGGVTRAYFFFFLIPCRHAVFAAFLTPAVMPSAMPAVFMPAHADVTPDCRLPLFCRRHASHRLPLPSALHASTLRGALRAVG